MYRYYREKLQVNHFWELKGKNVSQLKPSLVNIGWKEVQKIFKAEKIIKLTATGSLILTLTLLFSEKIGGHLC